MEGGARVKKTNKKSVTQSLKPSVRGSVIQSLKPSVSGSVIQSLSRRPQSKKLKSVNPSENQSLSARPKSTQIRSGASKKSAKVGSINPLIVRIKTLDTNLTKVEDALFFLLEIFHDIINDTRGSVADSTIIETYLEPKLR